MENQKSKKKRAVSSESNDVGSKRHELYKGVIGKINSAIEAGYYLEAITLEESLICDRFASRFTYLCKDKELEQKVEKKYLLGQNFYSMTLGDIKFIAEEIETNIEIKDFCNDSVFEWRNKRNFALHEIAKLTETDTDTFANKYSKLKEIAMDGLKVFREVDNLLRESKQS